MQISVKEMTNKYKAVLATTGASAKDVDTMTLLRLEQDLHQNLFSGLAELESAVKELRASLGKKYSIEVNKPALKLVNCNGRAAGLVTYELLSALCDMARNQGIAIIGYYNGGYQSMPEVFARAIATQDLVGLVASAGGPQGVVPFGGSKDILGTNPMAYGIPTNDLPIVFDGATAKYAYGSIRIAREKGEHLPERAYLDRAGAWTTDPNEAIAIIPFGEHKGYAINLLLEVLTGALVRAKSGLQVTGGQDLGGFLLAIDPAAFGPLDEFKTQTTQLARDIEAVPPAAGYAEVRVPGYKGERHKRAAVAADAIEIDDVLWRKFEQTCQKYGVQ